VISQDSHYTGVHKAILPGKLGKNPQSFLKYPLIDTHHLKATVGGKSLSIILLERIKPFII
jgi:hypothetical protein